MGDIRAKVNEPLRLSILPLLNNWILVRTKSKQGGIRHRLKLRLFSSYRNWILFPLLELTFSRFLLGALAVLSLLASQCVIRMDYQLCIVSFDRLLGLLG